MEELNCFGKGVINNFLISRESRRLSNKITFQINIKKYLCFIFAYETMVHFLSGFFDE